MTNHNPEFCANVCEREAGGTRKTRERARRAGSRDVDEDEVSGEIFFHCMKEEQAGRPR